MMVFPTIPHELTLQILESVDDHKDLISLISASHLFYDVWITSRRSILRIVIKRQIPGFEEALELFRVQKAGSQDTNDPILEAKYILGVARVVSEACDEFIRETGARFSRECIPMLPEERLRFNRIFYRIWVCAETHREQDTTSMSLQQLLPVNEIDDRDLQCICELSAWMLLVASRLFKATFLCDYCHIWAPVLGQIWRQGFSQEVPDARVGENFTVHPIGFVKPGESLGGFFSATNGFGEKWDSMYAMAMAVLGMYPRIMAPWNMYIPY
ncbi:hypothetical protein K440DRAFT_620897 [Wilcoxina mikolae CBS 423.85]|nr:hypothetical protein K440DRAFT_620897 [Wilcoxina mikolae CBS 423.85]